MLDRSYVIGICLCVACATADDQVTADARITGAVDAPVGSADAPTGSVDAPATTIDAPAIDAPSGAVDAATVDAPFVIADAAQIDGSLPIDAASPDAMVAIDATPPSDAPVGGGCVLQSPVFSQNTPTPILDVQTVTSTINIAGADPYLWKVVLTTAITHTYNGDLTLTLISPAGTRVTLSRELGSTADDVFNGSVWDDAAPTPVVDYSFTSGVTATPIAPEAAFGKLAGENPNGVWTLEVIDDASGDVGSINSWSLALTTSATPVPTTTVYTSTGPVAIPDNTTTTSLVSVAGAGSQICGIDLTTNITHSYSADLDLWLVSPAGTRTVLVTDNNAGGAANVFNGSLWDDETGVLVADYGFADGVTATPLAAEGAMGAFATENPNGTWTLEVADTATFDTGNIAGWSLSITTCVCP